MATSNILGLFMSPEQYQAQQLAQQQADEQTRATNFANLDARGQAVYGTFLGAQQLGRGFGGLLGVQDPQLQRIRQRDQLMQSINPADPESLMAGIQAATNAGDQELAMSLATYLREAEGNIALAAQRTAQANRERFQSQSAGAQEAELIGTLTEQLQKTTDPKVREVIQAKIKRLEKNLTKADELEDLFAAEVDAVAQATARAQATDKAAPSQAVGLYGSDTATPAAVNVDNDPRVKAIRARIKTLTATAGDKTYERLVIAERIGVLTDEIAAMKAAKTEDTPLYRRKVAELKSLEGDKAGAPIKELVLGEEIAKLDAFIRDAKDPAAPAVIDAKTKVQLYRDAMKRERPNLDTLGLAKGGKYDGQPVFLDENTRKTFVFDTDKTGKQIEVPYTGGLRSLKGGTEVNVGGSEVRVDTGTAGKAAGKKIGEELIDVKGKESALDSIANARDLLKQGIYAGAFGPERKFIAKYAGIGDAEKVARTEQFVSDIGEIVIPRLKDFGGQDSNQELKYLTDVMGGNIRLEPTSLARILESADRKIKRGIERLRAQAQSGENKESLITTLPPPADGTQTPTPKPTMRFNPATKKLERVQ
jgi:hypothetical protein